MKRPRRVGLWENGDFTRFWIGQTVSEFGSCMGALPLFAILVLQADPARMGILTACLTAPSLIISPAAGVWVDRVRRRPLLVASDLGRVVLLASLPIAVAFGMATFTHLTIVALLMGTLSAIFCIAAPSYLPALVEKKELLEANGKLSAANSVSESVGTPFGYVLAGVIGAPLMVLIDALTYLASAGSLASIRRREPPPAPPGEREGWRHELAEGIAVLVRHPVLWPLVSRSSLCAFFGAFFAALYSLYALETLGLAPAAVGVIIGCGGAGSLAGAILARPVTRRFGIGRSLIGASVVGGMANLLVPMASGSPWTSAGFLITSQVFGDAAWTVYLVSETSLWQGILPGRLLGRANAGYRFLAGGTASIGAMAGGFLGGAIGMRGALAIASVGMLLASLFLLVPRLRLEAGSLEKEDGTSPGLPSR